MDLLFSFSNGSRAIAHSGVKGMKWGVWNAETAARYKGGPGHRSIQRANKKVNKAAKEYETAVNKQGKDSYAARSADRKLKKAVEKREFRVEKNHPGEGKIDPDRYNELRSNQRVTRSSVAGAVAFGPWGAAGGYIVSTALSNAGKRTVGDLLKKKETYRINKKTGDYENTTPWSTEYNKSANYNPVYTKRSSR